MRQVTWHRVMGRRGIYLPALFLVSLVARGQAGRIAGTVDGVAGGHGTYTLNGWVCSAGSPDSIAVDVYVGGPGTTGTYIGRYRANVSSEPAVAQVCMSSGGAYRFEIGVGGLVAAHAGQALYVYGISQNPAPGNAVLAHSGSVFVPRSADAVMRANKLHVLVDCTVWGNCSANNPKCVEAGNCGEGIASTDPNKAQNTLGYAYGASILWDAGRYNAFFCSRGGETGGASSNAWDAIRSTTSRDGLSWSRPVVALTASSSAPTRENAAGTRDLAACDPSVVFFMGYFYMFYGAAHVVETGGHAVASTVIQVARAKAIEGAYLTYTSRGTWEASPADPQVVVAPVADSSGSYGAGQPSVMAYQGMLRMFYTDTSRPPKADGSGNTLVMDSRDPVHWPQAQARATDAPFVDTDVKYDPGSQRFVMYAVRYDVPAVSTSKARLLMGSSADGISWTAFRPLGITAPALPFHVDSIGVSADRMGRLVAKQAPLVSFGAPADLAPGAYLEEFPWDLWGTFCLTVGCS